MNNGRYVLRGFELLYNSEVSGLKILIVHLLTLLYKRVDYKDLAAFVYLLAHEVKDLFALALPGVFGDDWGAARREFI